MQNFPPPCTKSWHLGILRQVYNNLGHFYANKRYIVLFLGVFWCQILRGKNCVGANLYAFLGPPPSLFSLCSECTFSLLEHVP